MSNHGIFVHPNVFKQLNCHMVTRTICHIIWLWSQPIKSSRTIINKMACFRYQFWLIKELIQLWKSAVGLKATQQLQGNKAHDSEVSLALLLSGSKLDFQLHPLFEIETSSLRSRLWSLIYSNIKSLSSSFSWTITVLIGLQACKNINIYPSLDKDPIISFDWASNLLQISHFMISVKAAQFALSI